MSKEFGKLTRIELRQLFASLHELDQVNDEVASVIEDNQEKATHLLSLAPPWSIWYEFPFPHHLLYFFEVSGLIHEFKKAIQQNDPQQAAIDFLSSNSESALSQEVEEYNESEQKISRGQTL